MGGVWFCKLAGVTTGPLKPSELRALAHSGKLSPDDLVRHGAEGPWVPARNVRGLFDSPVIGGASGSGLSVSSDGKEMAGGGMPTRSSVPESGQKAGLGEVPVARILPQPPPVAEKASASTLDSPSPLESPPGKSETEVVLEFSKASPAARPSAKEASLPMAPLARRQQNNVVMMVVLAVVAVALLAVVILMFTGVLPLGEQSTPVAQTKLADASKSVASETEPSSEVTWADASKKAIRRGATLVSISSARLAPVPASWVEETGEYLLLDVEVKNQAEDKILFFSGWSRGDAAGNLLKLVDDKGTAYRQVVRKDMLGENDSGVEKILPGGSVRETLVFEPPQKLEGIEYFRLELPAKVFPKENWDPFRFQISGKMVRIGETAAGAGAKGKDLFGSEEPSSPSAKRPSPKGKPEVPPTQEVSEEPPQPKRKRDAAQEEFDLLQKELQEEEKPAPEGTKKASKGKPSAAEEQTPVPEEPSESKSSKTRRPRIPGQGILDELDTRLPPKESSKEKEE